MIGNSLRFREKVNMNKLINALTIEERYSLIGDVTSAGQDAMKRYAEIKSRANYTRLMEKCAAKGLTNQHFAAAFYEGTDERLNEKLFEYIEKQEWFVFFRNAADYYFTDSLRHEESFIKKYDVPHAVQFLILYARELLSVHFDTLKNITCSDAVLERIVSHLSSSCLQIYTKTVIYEYYLNIDSYHGKSKLSDYIRDTFFSLDGVCAFYAKYPVLLRRISVKIRNMLQYYKNMFSVLDAEYRNMVEYGLVSDDVITGISCSEGDTHEKGASVTILTYNRDEIVYKPRDLNITKKFTEFIRTINSAFDLCKLPTVRTIWGNGYTIEEKIMYRPCQDETGIRRFYERIGYYLAILYLFNGNDIHYENIIACGEHPYLIDLETLFSHGFEQFRRTGNAYEKATLKLTQSARGTHLLPSFIRDKKGGEKTDVSGLGGQYAKLPTQRLALTDWGTDHVRFTMQDVYLQDTNNIPSLNKRRVDYRNYTKEIKEGFEKFIRIALENKELFIRAAESFAGVKTRQVLRSTSDYAYMLQFASHPNYTSNMIHFERFLESVWNLPYINSLVNCCEEAELLVDDIPVFYCNADGMDLKSGSGMTVPAFYKIDGISAMKQRIAELNQQVIRKQLVHITCAFEQVDAFRQAEFGKLTEMNHFGNNDTKTAEVKPCDEIIRVLANEAICGDTADDVTWCAVSTTGEVAFLPVDLLNGSAGILAYLLELPETEETRKLIRQTVNGLISQKSPELFKEAVSGTCGWVSVLLPLSKYIERTYNEDAVTIMTNVTAWCENKISEQHGLDELKGLATVVIALLSLYEAKPDYKYLQIANNCVSLLMQEGSNCLRTVFDACGIRQASYAMELFNRYADMDSVREFIQKLDNTPANPEGPVSELKCMKYSLIRQLDCAKPSGLTVEDILGTIEGIELNNESLLLTALDVLILAGRCSIATDDLQAGKVTEKMNDLFSRCTYTAGQYNTAALGFGLESLLCGIGLRWEYAYHHNDSVYYRLI
jgi:type 2 lantibiotic biosynthesis protein LanM